MPQQRPVQQSQTAAQNAAPEDQPPRPCPWPPLPSCEYERIQQENIAEKKALFYAIFGVSLGGGEPSTEVKEKAEEIKQYYLETFGDELNSENYMLSPVLRLATDGDD